MLAHLVSIPSPDVAAVALATVLCLLALAAGDLFAGAAKVVITPPDDHQPVWLAGLGPGNRPSEGVHDDLYASALALRAGDEQLVWVALDLIGYLQNETRALRNQIEGLRPEQIAICCTHQHSGPDTLGIWGPGQLQSGVSERYMALLRDRVRQAIVNAVHNYRRARLLVGSVDVAGGLVRNAREGGALDRQLSVVQARATQDDEPIATLANFAAHPEILWYESRLLTADFPGYLRRELEKGGGVGLFVNGALGGMVTPSVTENTFQEAERIGTALAEAAAAALDEADVVDRLAIASRRGFVDVVPDNELMKMAAGVGFLKYDLTPEGRFRCEVQVFEMRDASTEDRTLNTANRALLQVACYPGEPVPELGLRAKQAMTAKHRLVFGLANDELGYLLLPEQYGTEEYELETRSCMGKQAGVVLTEALERLLGTG